MRALLFATAACLAHAGMAAAQAYPVRPVRAIIPAPAGGGVDTVGRAVSQKLSESLGQPFIADNRPGAGTMIGSELTARAAPDGYTLLFMTNSHAINAGVQKNLKFDPIKSFTTVSLLAISPCLLVVHPSVPVKSVRDLIELARKRPGELYFASAGNLSATHMAGELFAYMAKVKMVHVPYKGGAPAVTDLMGGHVQLMFDNLIAVMALARQGRLHALAITSLQRSPLMPEVPTVAEAGVPGYQASSWYGAALPANTPRAIVDTLYREMAKALKSPDVTARMANDGTQAVGSTPDEFDAFLRHDIENWTRLAQALGLKSE